MESGLKSQPMKQRKLNRVQLLLLGAALFLLAPAGALATKDGLTKLRLKTATLLKARATAQPAPVNAVFTVRSYGGKCMEYGKTPVNVDPTLKGYPIFINQCSGTTAQQIRVEELTDRPGRLVILRAGDKVIGAKTEPVGAPAGPPAAIGIADQTSLETQVFTNSPGQIFALDGDSIILAADRNLVVEVENNRGRNLTPLVLGRRDLADSEFWDFIAEDSSLRPTSGFRSASTAQELAALLPEFRPEPGTPEAEAQAKPGTVIEIDPFTIIELTGVVLRIPTGVTLRGSRRGVLRRAELWTDQPATWALLNPNGDDVRVTGLLLTGTSWSTVDDAPPSQGIFVRSDLHQRVIIDHNELWKWTDEAIDVEGDGEAPVVCRDHRSPQNSGVLPSVRVARNYIHHNRKQGAGYGVAAHYGGFPLIEGNTFSQNRHAIMADGKACTKYYAWRNLVLQEAPCQTKLGVCLWHTHDFDVHGTGDNGFGGQAGQYFEIAWNTFLGTNRENFDLRGEPSAMVEYHHNISLRSLGDAVACSNCGRGLDKLLVYDNNQFNVSNPVHDLRTGDFDGDGVNDLFLTTGAAWYYAPVGDAQVVYPDWRFINTQPEKVGDLLLGDFDADGRTDVFALRGSAWFISWGGASNWEKIIDAAEPNSQRRFLDGSYNGGNGPSDGSFSRPYTSFAEAVARTPADGTLWLLRTQALPAAGTYDKRITIKAAPGVKAIIGG
jgi:hypothetical protein